MTFKTFKGPLSRVGLVQLIWVSGMCLLLLLPTIFQLVGPKAHLHSAPGAMEFNQTTYFALTLPITLVAAMIACIGWLSRGREHSWTLTVLGSAFLAVAVLKLIHVAASALNPSTRELERMVVATVVSRMLLASGFLAATWGSPRRTASRRMEYRILALALLVSCLSGLAIWFQPWPTSLLISAGGEFTWAKRWIHMVLGPGFLVCAVRFLRTKAWRFEPSITILTAALGAWSLGEFCYFVNLTPFGPVARIGHVYHLLAALLTCLAVLKMASHQVVLDLNQTQEELKVKEERLRMAFEGAEEGYWDWDLQTDVLYRSPGALSIFGFFPDEVKPSLDSSAHWMDAPSFQEMQSALQEHLDGKSLRYRAELHCRTRDDRWIWVLDQGKVVEWDAENRPVRMAGTLKEITGRKLMEQALLMSETGLVRAQSKAHIGNWEYDLATRNLIWSDEVYRIFGHTPRAFRPTYEAFLASVHPEDREKVDRAVRQSIESHQSYLVEHRVVRSDGEERIVQEQGEVIYSDAGQPLSMFGIVQDMTEQRRAEVEMKALQDESRMLSWVARYTENSVIVTDAHSRITWVNDGFTTMTGYALPEVIGLKPGDFLQGPNSDPAVIEDIRQCMAQRQSFVAEIVNHRKSGEPFWVSLSVTPLRDDAGVVTHWIAIESDVTSRKTAEEALQQTQKLESLGLLAGGIAHDFNNLLGAIRGNVELAQIKLEAGRSPEAHSKNILSIVERASGLTRQLLAYAGKGTFLVKPMNINSMVQEMAALLSVSLPKMVHLDLSLAKDLPAVNGDATQLQQVIMNLVINAGDAIGDQPGEIRIVTRACALEPEGVHRNLQGQPVVPGPQVMLEVTDSGCGMAPEVLARIFDPFYTTKTHGRGLGLSAMLGILRSHHAGIQVESVPASGTTFRVFFPAADEVPECDILLGEPSRRYSGRALVADDDPELRATSAGLLESMGFQVVAAGDGQEAIERFRSEGPFQMVLMDVLMPKVNGFMACKLMASEDPELRIIHCSGSEQRDNQLQACLTCGLCRHHAFLTKPFGRHELQLALGDIFKANGHGKVPEPLTKH